MRCACSFAAQTSVLDLLVPQFHSAARALAARRSECTTRPAARESLHASAHDAASAMATTRAMRLLALVATTCALQPTLRTRPPARSRGSDARSFQMPTLDSYVKKDAKTITSREPGWLREAREVVVC